MTATGSYRLRSGRLHDVTGPLALLAGQAPTAAASGRDVVVTDSHGVSVAVIAGDSGLTVVPVGPIELFPQDTNPLPAWTTRLAELINQLGETP